MLSRRASSLVTVCVLCLVVPGCVQAPQRFEDRHPDGALRRQGTLAAGLQVGTWTYYYPTGARKAEGEFRDDQQHGKWSYWYENGQKEMEGEFIGQRRNGDWTYWHPGGATRARGRFAADRETGHWTFWNERGERDRSGHFEDGKLAHRWTYFKDGIAVAEGRYLVGVKAGNWTLAGASGAATRSAPLPAGWKLVEERSSQGTLRRDGFLRQGKPHGRWVSWHSGGQMRLLGDFDGGEPSGTWEAFHADGTRFALGSVTRGRPTGEWTITAQGRSSAVRLDGLRPPSALPGDWSADALSTDRSPEEAISIWLAEIAAPVDDSAGGYELAAARLEDRGNDEPGAPTIGAEVELTVSEVKRLPAIINGLEKGGVQYTRSSNLPAIAIGSGAASYTGHNKGGGETRGDEALARSFLGKTPPPALLRATDGAAVSLEAFRGAKNVLLVILRGFDGRVCEYCAGQTMALGRSRAELEKRDTEVIVVYPGRESRLQAFLEAYRNQFRAQPPRFQFVYDSELGFANALNIGPPEGKVARPTVLLVDKSGKVVFAHVGTRTEDRPTVEAILREIDRLRSTGAGEL